MTDLSALSFARPVPEIPDTLMAKLAADVELTDLEDEMLNRACGISPGYPEAFATREARDAALGPFGPYTRFVPATWVEAEVAGFPIASVAIGHALDDASFAEVAPPILDAVATVLQDDDAHDIIIYRTRYLVRRLAGGTVKAYGWTPEFDGEPIEVENALKTLSYLNDELNQRLRGNAS